ncbi:pre-mRNA-splicing factor SYF2 [Monocercomonoides exilis]|uniref:pre-mRNA-splicing factor SYF2 n=1 Tax=Monocercomonoides exilis TaxID=2049356 RepID=UPI003559EF6E|nr:pre-mRNA-splicing factor SYF2 [Monocercomonoides exilis]|eukprot:MONOS_12511.1-p1 / transcript=MONOS_12511.1 / gene=MONOS_12511 / organism=Monocercomonoides_exilis_PA203 / gene_product=pre-mRNA-splicing factor SYF2 / transcript_product=pre-mRNA-splicing factor SYF2 / location=Mono_scaffold00696:26512-27813(-) / protein_length=332 / sequence_SO=supercontig / SO=protein_coding / is_pseudo=false
MNNNTEEKISKEVTNDNSEISLKKIKRPSSFSDDSSDEELDSIKNKKYDLDDSSSEDNDHKDESGEGGEEKHMTDDSDDYKSNSEDTSSDISESDDETLDRLELNKRRLFELRLKMNEERKKIRDVIVEEELKKSLPFWKQEKIRRAKENQEKQEKLAAALESGETIDPSLMEETALEAGLRMKQAKKREKQKQLDGFHRDFVNYEATRKAFKKRSENLFVDLDEYERRKQNELTSSTASLSEKGQVILPVDRKRVDEFIKTLNKEDLRKEKFHRHRRSVGLMAGKDIDKEAEEEVDAIHEGNKKFNKKLRRDYDKHTTAIKESLERGTAV